MFCKANPYAETFFNDLSIVEICIDKGLSGGDLCSCQLSQRKAPLDTNRIDRHATHNWDAFQGRGVTSAACGPQRGEQAEQLKTSSSWESIGPTGLWPEGDRSAGGGSVKPLWVPGSRCEAWHWLWHTQGLDWHWPGCKHTEYTWIKS